MIHERPERKWPKRINQPLGIMHSSTKEGWASLVANRFWGTAINHLIAHRDCPPQHLREHLERRFRHNIPNPEILENLTHKRIGQANQKGELKRINLAIRTRNLLGDAGFFKK